MNRFHLPVLVAAALGVAVPSAAPPAPAEDTDAIIHVLNRVAFGPRPGDVDRVRQIGIRGYIAEQLKPARGNDEAVATRLRPLSTLTMSSREIAQQFEIPVLMARREQKRTAADMPPDSGKPAKERPADGERPNLPLIELSQQKVLRAVYSDRQLEEVLTDFWFNHFNVDARKGPGRFTLTEYERDAIRPHVLGRFRDLLGATAKSPSMLFYLDNWMSADPNAASKRPNDGAMMRRLPPDMRPGYRAGRPQTAPNPPQNAVRTPRGLNENYARELMELHTLGVDGGYTQKDVTEVARAFTGWTIDTPRAGGSYRFVPRLHDDGEKMVLGHRIKAGGGEHDGEEVLDVLASNPATARSIAKKLAIRFVADDPPASLVDRLAEKFISSKGDLRAVMTELLGADEFLATSSYSVKVKTPFEFVVSALRAVNADVTDARPIVRALQQQLGMPLYQCQPPTGYKDSSDAWVNSGALVSRMNLGLALGSGRLPGISVPSAVDASALTGGALSETTRQTIARATVPAQQIALALGSPEFQRR